MNALFLMEALNGYTEEELARDLLEDQPAEPLPALPKANAEPEQHRSRALRVTAWAVTTAASVLMIAGLVYLIAAAGKKPEKAPGGAAVSEISGSAAQTADSQAEASGLIENVDEIGNLVQKLIAQNDIRASVSVDSDENGSTVVFVVYEPGISYNPVQVLLEQHQPKVDTAKIRYRWTKYDSSEFSADKEPEPSKSTNDHKPDTEELRALIDSYVKKYVNRSGSRVNACVVSKPMYSRPIVVEYYVYNNQGKKFEPGITVPPGENPVAEHLKEYSIDASQVGYIWYECAEPIHTYQMPDSAAQPADAGTESEVVRMIEVIDYLDRIITENQYSATVSYGKYPSMPLVVEYHGNSNGNPVWSYLHVRANQAHLEKLYCPLKDISYVWYRNSETLRADPPELVRTPAYTQEQLETSAHILMKAAAERSLITAMGTYAENGCIGVGVSCVKKKQDVLDLMHELGIPDDMVEFWIEGPINEYDGTETAYTQKQLEASELILRTAAEERGILSPDCMTSIGVYVKKGCIGVGIVSADKKQDVLDLMRELGIPDDMVKFEIAGAAKAMDDE